MTAAVLVSLVFIAGVAALAAYVLRYGLGMMEHEVYPGKWYAAGAGIILALCAVAAVVVVLR